MGSVPSEDGSWVKDPRRRKPRAKIEEKKTAANGRSGLCTGMLGPRGGGWGAPRLGLLRFFLAFHRTKNIFIIFGFFF